MKTVYVDVVLLVNLCSDYTVLYLCSRFLHINVCFSRLLSAALFGALYGLFCAVIPQFNSLCVPAIIIMCLIAFGKRNVQTYARILLSVMIFSLLLAGLLDLVCTCSIVEYGVLKGVGIIIASLMGLGVLSVYTKRIFNGQTNTESVFAQIRLDKSSIDTVLLSDSGNFLTEPESGRSIIVLDTRFRRMFSAQREALNLISFRTVSGQGIIEVYSADSIVVKGNEVDVYIGFCVNSLCTFDGYDGIIPGVVVQNL